MSVGYYEHVLTGDLREMVAGQLKKLVPEQLALNEEVAVYKAFLSDLVKEWATSREAVKVLEQLPAGKETAEAIRLAKINLHAVSSRMEEAMKVHKDLAVSASCVEAKAREVLTERTFMLLMNSVIDLVHEYFNEGTLESINKLAQFEDDLRIRTQVQEQDNLSLAIEAEFFAMAGTIEGPTNDES